MRTRVCVLTLAVSLAAFSVFPQTVLHRTRLGHVIEDLDTLDKRLVALDGQEVFVANAKGGFEKLFSVASGGADHCPGLAYVPTEKVFLALCTNNMSQFFVFDDKGQPLGTRAITYMGGFTPAHVEAGTYLPKDSPFPDHVAFLAFQPTSDPYLEVAKLDGTVVHHVALPALFQDSTFGFAAAGGNKLYVIKDGTELYTIDYDAQVLAGPVHIDDGYAVEGIATVGDRVFVRDYFGDKFIAFDTSLQRVPADDLRHDFGLAFGSLVSVTWNSDTHRFAILSTAATNIPLLNMAFDVVPSLDDARPLFFPKGHGFDRPRSMSWMPDEHKYAVSHTQPQRRILIFSAQGTLLEQLDVTPLGRPVHLAYIPSTHEFYLRTVELPSTIRVLSRTGALVRDLNLSALGTTIGPFTHTGGQLVTYAGGLLYRLDLDGNVLASYDPAPLNVPPTSLAAITSGPLAGKFAVTSNRNAEVVIFSLP